MDESQSSQDGIPKSKYTYRHLNALSSSTLPKDNPLRCVVLIDLDCFYAQVEQVRLGIPKDEPLAVQQWQQSTSKLLHSLLSNDSPARKFGIGRHMNATEARELCPKIHLAHVQTWVEGDSEPQYHKNPTVETHKVSLDPYRRASLEILKIFQAHCDRVEKASIDESFLDISTVVKTKLLERYPELSQALPHNDKSCPLPPAPSVTFSDEMGAIVPLSEGESEEDAVDWDDVVMYIAAEVVSEIRREVEEKLNYTCSAGIAPNKILAKLAAGWKKPNQQTILRKRAAFDFLKDKKFTDIRNLGGKLGEEVAAAFDTDKVSDIRKYSEDQLRAKLGPDQGSWVYNACQGIDHSEVNSRTKIKSMLSTKNFQPALNTSESAARWLRVLTADLAVRIREDEDHRLPRTITIHHRHSGFTKSRQSPLPMTKEMDKEFLFNHALSLWRVIETEGRTFPTNNISVAVSGFGDIEDGIQGIQGFLVPVKKIPNSATQVLGKRKKKDHSVIEKFFRNKEDSFLETGDAMEEEEITHVKEEDTWETYLCSQCSQRIHLEEMEIHCDYHVALKLSKESDVRSTSTTQAKPKVSGKEERKRPKKKIKREERGQRKLSFGCN